MNTASDMPPPDDVVVSRGPPGRTPRTARRLALRREIPPWQSAAYGLLAVLACLGLWSWLTSGATPEARIISPTILPSPRETWDSLPGLWHDQALSRNLAQTLKRVVLGFALAVLVGVPLGVLCGCFSAVGAFFAPLMIFGRNIPVAALIPLTFSLFSIGELQKVMFLFIACVAFVVGDAALAVREVSERYVDTAYTLGASRRQVILKVLLPLALPSIFNSARLLFGLAFGYIMLAESVQLGSTAGGIGHIINLAQGRGNNQRHILLILMIIPVVAFGIDRLLFWVQRELFPHQYGGNGLLRALARFSLNRWEDCQSLLLPRRSSAEAIQTLRGTAGSSSEGPLP
jgi:NitT/TauT family transport system permease protein